MRIVQLSTYDEYGGAAIAAMRLHCGLRAAGEDSRMLVRQRRSGHWSIVQPGGRLMRMWQRGQRRIDRLPLAFAGERSRGFSIGWAPDGVLRAADALSPDLVHAHWIADGLMRLESLARIGVPLVWTMHDVWAFTGGCHYPGSCEKYKVQCGCCPLLDERNETDFSRQGWVRRSEIFARRRITFIAPSRWIARVAGASTLLGQADIRVIANGIDTTCFAPQDRLRARTALGLPAEGFLLITAAAEWDKNPRKGFALLQSALRRIRSAEVKLEVVVFGGGNQRTTEVEGFRLHALGVIKGDAALARAYAAADIFVLPSLEDNLPNTALEAMAVGVPVIACAAGGIPDIVDHGQNGLLTPVGRADELADAISRMAGDAALRSSCGRGAREKAQREFNLVDAVAKHRALYQELLQRR